MKRQDPPIILALLLALVLCAAAGDPPPEAPGAAPSDLEQLHREVSRPVDGEDPFADGRVPDLVLLTSTNVNGETAPCGCGRSPKGGLARRASVIDTARAMAPRVVLLDAGDFTGVQDASGSTRGLFLLEMTRKFGYDAITIGEGDSRLGLDLIRSLASDPSLPVVSANLRDHETGKLLFPQMRIIEKSGVKVGVTAVTAASSPEGGELAKIGIDAGDAEKALSDVLPALRRKSDVTVLMARMTLEQAKALGERLPDLIDVVVVGSNEVGRDLVHRENGGAVYVTSGDRGYALGRVRMQLGENRRPERIVGDEIVLITSVGEKPEILRLVEDFRNNLNELLKEEAVRTAQSHSAPDGSYYVGAAKCAQCHKREFDLWLETKHAHAFETLVQAKSEALPECFQCHTTGARDAGGYVAGTEESESLVNVQCEVCHGKGSHHARDGSYGRGLLRAACAKCHDPANSPDFDPETYWLMIEHGGRASGSSTEAAHETGSTALGSQPVQRPR